MSYTFGLDCSSVEMGLGIFGETGAVCAQSRYVANSHAEHIARSVEMLLQSASIKAQQIHRVGVAVGPGSFTGLRIGLAFLKGFCFESDARVLPISSLRSLAFAWGPVGSEVVAAFDARRDEVFWARFQWDGVRLIRRTDDTLSPAADFAASLGSGDTVITDTLGFTRSTVFQNLLERQKVYSVEHFPRQRGLACAQLAHTASREAPEWVSPSAVLPRYLRLSYAEEQRAKHQEKP